MNDYNAVRQDQIRAGRTLSLAEGAPRPRPRPEFNKSQGRPQRPQAPRGNTHDARLKRAQEEGKQVRIVMFDDGAKLIGTVVERDKYTITLQTNRGIEVIYKHAISRFRVLETGHAEKEELAE